MAAPIHANNEVLDGALARLDGVPGCSVSAESLTKSLVLLVSRLRLGSSLYCPGPHSDSPKRQAQRSQHPNPALMPIEFSSLLIQHA